MQIIQNFVNNPLINTIFVSKVGDTSFDMPEISSHGGSRRQEAQRLGRILRAKKESLAEEFNAFFYSLVSTDTEEVYFCSKRQRFLINQGYSYKVVTELKEMDKTKLSYSSPKEQRDLLQIVLSANEADGDIEQLADNSLTSTRTSKKLSSYSGVEGLTYTEYSRSTKKSNERRHPLFKKYRP